MKRIRCLTVLMGVVIATAAISWGSAQNEVTSPPVTKQQKAQALAQEQQREDAQKSQNKAQKSVEKSQKKAQKNAQKEQKKAQKQWQQQHPSVH